MTDTLRDLRAAMIDEAPTLNTELRPDGSEDPRAAAYVDGWKDAIAALDAWIAAHPAPEPGRCTCGLPGCSDEPDTADRCTCGMAEQERTGHDPEHAEWCEVAPEPAPAGSGTADEQCDGTCASPENLRTKPHVHAVTDTADEPRVCGERYGVEPGICRKPEGHEGWHDDGTGQWPVEPVPSPAPEDEREALLDVLATTTDPRTDTEAAFGDEVDVIIAAGWRSPTGVAALVDEREAKMAGEIRRHADHMESYTLPAISPGFIDGFRHALRLLRRDADFIAARAATKAVSDD